MYLDKTGFETDAPREYGYAVKGSLVYGTKNANRRPGTSLVMALHQGTYLAPLLFAGTCNALLFNAWLAEHLLKELPPKSLVIMDNATFHKQKQTKEIIEKHGHKLLYLAPYSPDHNPIEHTFAHHKLPWADAHGVSLIQASLVQSLLHPDI